MHIPLSKYFFLFTVVTFLNKLHRKIILNLKMLVGVEINKCVEILIAACKPSVGIYVYVLT